MSAMLEALFVKNQALTNPLAYQRVAMFHGYFGCDIKYHQPVPASISEFAANDGLQKLSRAKTIADREYSEPLNQPNDQD